MSKRILTLLVAVLVFAFAATASAGPLGHNGDGTYRSAGFTVGDGASASPSAAAPGQTGIFPGKAASAPGHQKGNDDTFQAQGALGHNGDGTYRAP